MTSRERILAAMHHKKPDRIPLMCQFSWGFMNQQLKTMGISPMELWLDAGKYAQGLILLRDRFQFDGILVSVHGHFSKWREKIQKLEFVEGVEVATFENRTETYVDDDLPQGKYFKSRERSMESCDPSMIPGKLDYINATKDCYIYIDTKDPYRVFRILNRELKGRFSLHGEVSSPLDYLLDFLGYENSLMAMATDPEKTGRILNKFTEGVADMASDMASLSCIDAIKISSPFAGKGFISPGMYRMFELPYLKRVTQAINNRGKFSYVHTCGHINDRLELMAEAGLSGIECLDPPPIGNVELEDAFSRIGKKMFIKGNIDSVNTLLNGDESLINEDVIKRIKTGMNNPGYILSTACSIAPKVPAEKIRMLHDLVEQYGYY